MKHRNLFIGLSCMAAGLCACNDEYTFVPEYEVKLPTDTTINVTIDASTVYQTIDGFASSDAWDMEYVGKYWSTSNKEAIAKLLFSREQRELAGHRFIHVAVQSGRGFGRTRRCEWHCFG